jgi:hypothetical protein
MVKIGVHEQLRPYYGEEGAEEPDRGASCGDARE